MDSKRVINTRAFILIFSAFSLGMSEFIVYAIPTNIAVGIGAKESEVVFLRPYSLGHTP